MNGCNNCAKRRDAQKECPWGGTYHHRGEHGERIGTCNAYRKETYADRIRSMSVEELAAWIAKEILNLEWNSGAFKMAVSGWKEYLQQPAPEVSDEADS